MVTIGVNGSRRRNSRTLFGEVAAAAIDYRYRKTGHGYPTAVNATNFEPAVLQGARIRKLDGASTWTWEYAD
jgi:hypothetical protein